MFGVQAVRSPIKVGSGKSSMATKMGKKRVEVIQKGGTSGTFVLTGVKFVPGLFVNLFSIGKTLKNGFKISNKGCVISLQKGDSVISFDRTSREAIRDPAQNSSAWTYIILYPVRNYGTFSRRRQHKTEVYLHSTVILCTVQTTAHRI
jgi:hypothetical protein